VLAACVDGKGVDEVLRAKEGIADERGKPVLERAIAAAGEVQKRGGQPNVTEDVIDEASFYEPIFYSKLGKNVETVDESLDYIKNHAKNKDRTAQRAVERADRGRCAAERPGRDDPAGVSDLIDRTWAAGAVDGAD